MADKEASTTASTSQPGSSQPNEPPRKRQKTKAAVKASDNVPKPPTKLVFLDDKPFSKQPKATQNHIKKVEASGLSFSQQFHELPEKAQKFLVERSEMTQILQPFSSPVVRNAFTISVIEAARSSDEGDKPKTGKARRKAAEAYAPTVLADFLPQLKAKVQRSGTVRRSRDERMVPDPGADEDFDVFVQQCAKYLEEGKFTNITVLRSDQWKIYANFYNWNTFEMVTKMQSLLADALKAEMKRQELIRNHVAGPQSSLSVNALHIQPDDTEHLRKTIRAHSTTQDIARLQEAYLQMLLAKNVENGYKAYAEEFKEKHKHDLKPPKPMPDTQYFSKLYTSWKEEDIGNKVNQKDWQNEVQLGNRWRVWSDVKSQRSRTVHYVLTFF